MTVIGQQKIRVEFKWPIMHSTRDHHRCSALKQALGIQFLQPSLSIAFHLIFSEVLLALMSSSNMIRGLSLLFHLSFDHFFSRLFFLKICLTHRFFLSNKMFKILIFSFSRSNTHSFLLWSFQLIFSILSHVQISKASNLSLSYFLSFKSNLWM